MKEGPKLNDLLHRLADCPEAFLESPRIKGNGTLHVNALVADLLRDYQGDSGAHFNTQAWLGDHPGDPNRLSLVSIACWLLADPGVREKVGGASQVQEFLRRGMDGLAGVVEARKCVQDEERREEFARFCLLQLGLKPEGETDSQAEDRFATLDSVEQRQILRDTAQAQRRAEEVREALRRKAAEEAAAKVSRE